MRMRPTPFVVPKSGDPFENDQLGRKDQIESLTHLLRNIEGSCVLAIDGSWGSGKTVFLKMWAQFLRKQRFRVAELNAWETDYSDDPLIVLYAAIEDELGRSSMPKNKKALTAGAKLASKVLSDAIPLIPDVAEAVDTAKKSSENSTEIRLTLFRETEEAIGEFKKTLRAANKNRLPLIIFVDELDRCRPDYAIRFLEATKHIFDVEGVVFILGVNLSELAHSVSALYGTGFDGEIYLRRFVDRSLHLPQADREQLIEELLKSVGLEDQITPDHYIKDLIDIILLEASSMSLRDLEQCVHHLGIVLSIIPKPPRFPNLVPSLDISLGQIATVLLLIRTVHMGNLPSICSR